MIPQKLRKVFVDLHLHSKDQYDSDNAADRVCNRIAELGGKAVALTQHGVASQVESFKKASKKYGLKFIPGIEAYYKMFGKERHLILLAMDDLGWKTLCMAITDSQDKAGRAVMDEALIRRYFGENGPGHGHVIATSACINGVIAGTMRGNEFLEKEIAKIEKRMARAVKGDVSEDQIAMVNEELSLLEKEEEEKRSEYEKLKTIATMRFAKREKAVSKIADEKARMEAETELARDVETSRAAAEKLPECKVQLDGLKKRVGAMRREQRELQSIMDKKEKYLREISELREGLEEEETLEIRAEEDMKRFVEIFGDGNFYAEVQNHGFDEEAWIYPAVAKIARRLHVPIVASNDVHTVDNSEDELLRRRMLRALRFEEWQDDQPGDDQLYIKTDGELTEWLLRILPEDIIKEATENTVKIVDRCNVEFKTAVHYPKYIPSDGRSAVEVFEDLVEKGLTKLFPDGLPEGYRERVDHEIGVIKTMGYVDYHLVVRDFMNYAAKYDYIPPERINEAPIDADELDRWIAENGYTEKVGLSNGTGRGSAVGSLVCYALGITHLDPIKYGLYFERFLNPERVSMPDIDSDISRTVRPRVIEYVKRKYGEDCVCGIMTQNAQAPRGAIRNAARCYGLYKNKDNKKDNGAKQFLSLADQIAKKVPMDPGISFDSKTDDGISVYQSLRSDYMDNEDALEIIRWAKVFEGCFTAYGAHAAGIVITDGTPVKEIIPMRWNDALGIYTTQCNMFEVEEAGMLKFDFLGLKTVDIINDCLWQLKREGISVDIYKIPLDDKKVFREIFSKGQTDSVFQFESSGMKQMLRRFKPECFEDLILLVSMFRPGPLQYLDDVIDVKNGVKEMTFLDEKLRPILGKTYSAIAYQEQVMAIFQNLAGYTLGGADLVRRAMSKKKLAVLEKERKAFVYGDPERNILGCVNNGVSVEAADKLFDQMTEFAKYAFNASHAAAYAYNSYITGWLKCHYPAEFLMAAMRWAEKTQRKDPIPGLMAEAKAMGVEVKQPDVNSSGAKFTVEDGKILFGLGAVKSVGVSADAILKERRNGKFRSLHDFFRRCDIKRNAVENLIAAGAFDSLSRGRSRKAMADAVDMFKKSSSAIRKKESFIGTAKAMLPYVDSISDAQKLRDKQINLGLSVELKDVTTAERLQKRISSAEKSLRDLEAGYRAVSVSAEIREDLTEKMERERELLGAYVTCHPLDGYITDDGGKTSPIAEMTIDTKSIFGFVRSVSIKHRKKDGRPLAFVELEDRTGYVRVNVFTDIYDRYSHMLKNGNVLIINGNAREEDVFGQDPENQEKEFVFTAREIHEADRRLSSYVMQVSSYAVFHLYEEDAFRELYEEKTKKKGHPFYIFDEKMGEIREASYYIKEEAYRDGKVKIQ